MIYQDRYDYNETHIAKLLLSKSSKDIVEAIVTTVFASENYDLSVSLVFKHLDHPNLHIRAQASYQIGHIFRVYKRLDLNLLTFLEKSVLIDNFDNCDSIEDAWTFCLKSDGNIDEYQDSHPLLYNFRVCNLIVQKFMKTSPEKGIQILRTKLNLPSFKPQILRDKVISSIEYIYLFK